MSSNVPVVEYGPLFEAILARSNEGVAAFGHDGVTIAANPAFHTILETPAAIAGRGQVAAIIDHAAGLVQDGDGFRERLADARARETDDERRPELAATRDGRVLEWRVEPLLIYGARYGWVWTIADVTARERATVELSGYERRLEQARALAGVGTWEIDAESGEITWSDDVSELLGVEGRGRQPWVDEGVRWVDPGAAESMRRDVERSLREGTAFSRVDRLWLPDGRQRVVRGLGHPLRDESGRVIRLVGTIQEVSEPQRSTRELLLAALDSSPVPTAVIDAEATVVHTNEPFTTATGHTAGVSLWEIVEREPGDEWQDATRLADGWQSANRRYRTADGEWMPAAVNLALMPGDDAQEIIVRVLDRGLSRPEAEHADGRDPLTGMPIASELDQQLTAALQAGKPVGLLVVDLDRFAAVNERFGRSQGDLALRAFAQRVQHTAGTRRVARVGGDELAVLLVDPTPEQALDLARALQRAVAAPLNLGDATLEQRSCVGVVLSAPADTTPERLFHEAMTARRVAYERGGDAIFVLDADTRQQLRDQARLAAELRRAFETGALTIAFQPVIDVDHEVVSSLEALVRWNDPERGAVSPEQFIPIAERSGLMLPITTWVLDTVCEQIAAWRRAGVRTRPVAVNIAPQQLLRDDFVDAVEHALTRSGAPPEALVLELNERSMIDLPPASGDRLRALRELGVVAVLDHFGAGASSLARFKELPVNGIKIDRSFITGLPGDRYSHAIVDAVIEMSRTLGLCPVAAGVETAEQFRAVRRVGCAFVQGFLFCPPLPADRVPAVLEGAVPSPVGEEETMSLGAAAQALGVSASTVRRWDDEGRLTSVRTPGGHRRIRRAEVERHAAANRARPTPRLPAPPQAPLPSVGATIVKRADWIQGVAPRAVYAGDDHGWFSTPGGTHELKRWLIALGHGLAEGAFDRVVNATVTMLRGARAAGVPLPERVALLEAVLSAARAASRDAQDEDLHDELRELERTRLALRRLALEHA